MSKGFSCTTFMVAVNARYVLRGKRDVKLFWPHSSPYIRPINPLNRFLLFNGS